MKHGLPVREEIRQRNGVVPRVLMTWVMAITIVMCTVFASTEGSAATIPAATCSYADVNAAVSTALTGDTVTIPAGTCSWGGNQLVVSRAINIVGAGSGNSPSCNGSTSTCISGTGSLIAFSTSNTPQRFAFRLSNVYLATTGASNYGHIIDINGAGSGWRIHHNYLYHDYGVNGVAKAIVGVTATVAYFNLYGLIDSNVFKNAYVYLGGGAGSAEDGWKQASQWGTANALFIENNHFDGSDATVLGVAVDNQNGGRATIRYNIFDEMYLMIHSACQTTVRAGRSYEVYNNLFRSTLPTASSVPYYVHLRGGSALVSNNSVIGIWSWGGGNQGYVAVDNRRSWFDAACTAQLGDCNGTSVVDGNNQANGYRCLDGIGNGQQTGSLGTIGNPNTTQASDPVYVWGNTSARTCLSGADRYKVCTANGNCVNNDCSTQVLSPNNVYKVNDSNNQPLQIVSGRDYYDAASGSNTKVYTTYACPHQIVGRGTCQTDTAGTAGYSVDRGRSSVRPPTNLRQR